MRVPPPFPGDRSAPRPSLPHFLGGGGEFGDPGLFQTPAYLGGTWPFYFILSLISGQGELPEGSACRCFPGGSGGPPRGCGGRRWRGSPRPPRVRRSPRSGPGGSRGTSTGPQLPLAASASPPRVGGGGGHKAVPLGCPPFRGSHESWPCPVPSRFAPQKAAVGTAAPGTVGPGRGGGTRERSAPRAVSWLNTDRIMPRSVL